MSHHHCEVIIPPAFGTSADAIDAALEQILGPFSEHKSERTGNEFWDFWKIGGRWTGVKQQSSVPEKMLDEFMEELTRLGVTVSGIQFGKQALSPKSQEEAVDALWRNWFPGTAERCPLFAHADGFDDVIPVCNLPVGLTAERVIVAKPHWEDPARLEAGHMRCQRYWNSVEWEQTVSDGKVVPLLLDLKVPGDWLSVTVDYHS